MTFSASVYPIIDSEILKNEGGKTLKTFVRNGGGIFPEMWKVLPPLCYFHHNKQKNTLLCFNDFLGSGKLYSYSDSKISIIASSPLAMALVMPQSPEMEDKFWNTHHVFGYGVGNYSYIKSIQLVDPGTKVTIANGKTVQVSLYGYQKLLNLKLNNDHSLVYSTEEVIESSVEALKPYINKNDKNNLDEVIKDTKLSINHSILEYGLQWFKFSSGDCKPDLLYSRLESERDSKFGKSKVRFSYIGSNLAGGVDYSSLELTHHSSQRIKSLIEWHEETCYVMPNNIKEESINIYKSELFNALNTGIKGFYLLDYAHGAMNLRKSLPTGLTFDSDKAILVHPLFSAQSALDNFWRDESDKCSGNVNLEVFEDILKSNSLSVETYSLNRKLNFTKESILVDLKKIFSEFRQMEVRERDIIKLVDEIEQSDDRAIQLVESVIWRVSAKRVLEEVLKIREEKIN